MGLKSLLRDEIQDEFQELKKLEVGTDQYRTAVDGVTKLIDKSIEYEKFEEDIRQKEKNRDIEFELKSKELEIDRKDKKVKNGLTFLSIGGTIGLTIWGSLKAWKFEENGTVTSTAGRKFIDNLVTGFTKLFKK